MTAFDQLKQATHNLYDVAADSDQFAHREESVIRAFGKALSQTDGICQSLTLAFRAVHQQIGAPGDWGYGTPEGDSLKSFYDAWNLSTSEAAQAAQAGFDPVAMGC